MTNITAQELETYIEALLHRWNLPTHPESENILAWPIDKKQEAYNHYVRIKKLIKAAAAFHQENVERYKKNDHDRSAV